jgi:acylglycerol lipase
MKNLFLIESDALNASAKPLQGNIKASDGVILAYNAYTSDNPKGCLIFFHGGGAHGFAGYTLMAEQLCLQYHIATYLFDIRGHGLSGGTRGHTPKVEQVWKDVSSAITLLKQKFSDLPIYLGGHSSGAGLVLNYSYWSKSLPVNAYILVAPELGYRALVKVIYSQKEDEFARVNLLPILANRLTFGYLFGNSLGVEFNYPKDLTEREGLLSAYTVNMCRAVTPDDPVTALTNLKSPTCILISEMMS